MRQRLRYLPLPEVSAGMVLGAPLALADHGVTNFTLPAGHELTEGSLRQIASRHGEFVCVLEEDQRSEAECQADREREMKRLEQVFAHADLSPHSALASLYAAVLAYRSQ